MADDDKSILRELEAEVEAEQGRIPTLSGQALYDSCKLIIENLDTIFRLLSDNDANQA